MDPDGDPLNYSLITGPKGMSLSASGLLTWTADSQQTTMPTVRVDDGQAYIEQTWSLQVIPASAQLQLGLSIVPDAVLPGETVTLQLFPKNAIGQTTLTLEIDGQGVALDNHHVAHITAAGKGLRTVIGTLTDQHGSVTKTGSFQVIDPTSTMAPVVTLETPLEDGEITAPTDIIASISDDDLLRWELWLYPSSELSVDASQMTLLASGNSTFNKQVIAEFDPTLLLIGQRSLYLKAVDAGGNVGFDTRAIEILCEMKLGHFSITFKDLEIPLSGIPITVTRTYDSRRRNESLDFGQGWSVGYQNMRVQENRPSGYSWFLDSYQSGILKLLTTFCVRPYGDNIVTVTRPDGKVDRFKAKADPECNEMLPLLDVELVYEPMEGTTSTLEALHNQKGRLHSQHLNDPQWPYPLDVDRYRLTTRDGTVYELEQGIGINTITVPSGDKLTFTYNGITHSIG
jgi:hypothetical protein